MTAGRQPHASNAWLTVHNLGVNGYSIPALIATIGQPLRVDIGNGAGPTAVRAAGPGDGAVGAGQRAQRQVAKAGGDDAGLSEWIGHRGRSGAGRQGGR